MQNLMFKLEETNGEKLRALMEKFSDARCKRAELYLARSYEVFALAALNGANDTKSRAVWVRRWLRTGAES